LHTLTHLCYAAFFSVDCDKIHNIIFI